MNTNLRELKTALEVAAMAIETNEQDNFQPLTEGANIKDAAQRLRAILGPDVHFGITPKMDYYSTDDFKVEWTVYIGSCSQNRAKGKQGGINIEGDTLALAMNAALIHLSPPVESTVEQVQAALTCDNNIPF
jgi:hypothetical protein